MSGYSFGDGSQVPRALAHSIADPLQHAVGKAKKVKGQHERDELFHQRTRDIANDSHERTKHFVTGQQSHELASKALDQAHEAKMLRLSHTLQRQTVTHERNTGVTSSNGMFSTPTVQASGGQRTFAKPKKDKPAGPAAPSSSYESTPLSPTPSASKPAAARKPRKAAAPKPVPGVSFSDAR